jgi:DNA-directed RNA polymerase specialized sigma24 family protein
MAGNFMRRFTQRGAEDSAPATFGDTFRDGAISAVEQLIAAYGARAYGLAREILQHDEAAQDTASDALRLVLEQREVAPDQLASIGTWWLAATRRSALDRRRGRLVDSESIASLVPVADTDATTIRSALPAISPEQRELLTVVVLEGLTVTEAARRFGIPLPIAIARLSVAMGTLSVAIAQPPVITPADGE